MLLKIGFQQEFNSFCSCLPLAKLLQQVMGPPWSLSRSCHSKLGMLCFLWFAALSWVTSEVPTPGSSIKQLDAFRRCNRCSQAFIFQGLQIAGSVFYFSGLSIASHLHRAKEQTHLDNFLLRQRLYLTTIPGSLSNSP